VIVVNPGYPRIDSTPLHGIWSATDEATPGFVQLEVRAPDENSLALSACAAGPAGVVRLADAAARAYGPAASGDGAASAMTATIRSDGLSALLTFYLKGEILVLDAFITPAPGDSRFPHYARELFHRADPERTTDLESRGYTDERRTARPRYTAVQPGAQPVAIDITRLAGDWDNVNRASPDVQRVTVSVANGACLQWSSAAAGAADLHWSAIVPFAVAADDMTSVGFTSRMTGTGSEAIVTAYSTRGILVLDCHVHCEDERGDHLVREFFSRHWSPDESRP
jgi:hypothetical protein